MVLPFPGGTGPGGWATCGRYYTTSNTLRDVSIASFNVYCDRVHRPRVFHFVQDARMMRLAPSFIVPLIQAHALAG